MTNDRMKRLFALLAALACAAVFAAGCGDDDGDGGGGGGGDTPTIGTTQEQTDAPDSKDEAIDRCFEEAKKLEGQARETAEASCRSAETGETDELKEEAKEQCLESTKQIPDEAARKQAEDACEKFGD
ncbi:MAG: hypothetical protein M3340_07670 [Actinomycetota bacterium]|nr:hypothetical protein [Actinomycetota bacterium]